MRRRNFSKEAFGDAAERLEELCFFSRRRGGLLEASLQTSRGFTNADLTRERAPAFKVFPLSSIAS